MDWIGLKYNRKKWQDIVTARSLWCFSFFLLFFFFFLALLKIVNLCLTCILTWQVKLKDAIHVSFVRSHC